MIRLSELLALPARQRGKSAAEVAAIVRDKPDRLAIKPPEACRIDASTIFHEDWGTSIVGALFAWAGRPGPSPMLLRILTSWRSGAGESTAGMR